MAGSVKPTQLTTYKHVGMDGSMDIQQTKSLAIEPILELDFYFFLSFFFSVFIYALFDTFDLINFKLTPYIYSSAFLILHPTFGTLQSALSLSLFYRSACFDTDSSFISFAQHQIIFICNFKMLFDINW